MNEAPSPSSLSQRLRTLAKRSLREHLVVIAALAVRGGGVLAGFAVTYLIGSRLGAAATGQFALVSQTALFLSVIALLGLNISVVRHFSKSVAKKLPLALIAVLRVTGLGFGLMALVALALWLGGDLVWERLFGTAVPREFLPVLCILLITRGGVQLFGGMLRSQHDFTLGQAIVVLTIPAATAIALAAGYVETVEGALWVGAVTGIASIAIGALVLLRRLSVKSEAVDVPLRTVVISSLPLWGVGIAQNIGDWYSLAVAAQMLSAADAGLYRVGVQIAMALQVIANALFSVYSAQISAAFHAEDRSKAARLARSAVRISSAIAIPVAAVLLVAAPYILAQIGPEFEGALPVLIVLIFGQLAFTLTGPCGLVLAMSGNERINLAITIAGTVLVLAAVPLGAYFFGLTGIAVAMSVTLLLRNLVAYFVVRQKEGIDIWMGRVIERDASV